MSFTKHLDEDLLKQLECPVCTNYLTSPITPCQNGHNICAKCKSHAPICPSCGGQFLPFRNVTLEEIAKTTMYPCKNRAGGCLQIFSMDNRDDHETECLYKNEKCPFTKISKDSCPWTGNVSSTGNHVRQDHSSETRSVTGLFKLRLETLCASKYFREAVFAMGELFFIFWEIKDCNIYFAVFHIGPESDAEKFSYNFKIKMHNDKISMRAICHSYLQDVDSVLQPGECVALPYGTVLKYLSKCNDLSCEIEIRKCKDASVFGVVSKWLEDQTSLLAGIEISAPHSPV